MAGQCWVCKRQARGLGHSDNRFKVGEARRYTTQVECERFVASPVSITATE